MTGVQTCALPISLLPNLVAETPNLLTLIGIGGVVCGSALCALGAPARRQAQVAERFKP